jgi:hypothetical protein
VPTAIFQKVARAMIAQRFRVISEFGRNMMEALDIVGAVVLTRENRGSIEVGTVVIVDTRNNLYWSPHVHGNITHLL